MKKQDCIDIINLTLALHAMGLPPHVVNDMAAALADASVQDQEHPEIVQDNIEFHELRPTRPSGLWGKLRKFEHVP